MYTDDSHHVAQRHSTAHYMKLDDGLECVNHPMVNIILLLLHYERASGADLREKSEYSRPGPTPLKSSISGTVCLVDKRSSLMNTTWMFKLYGMVTILRQCRSWRVARAKLGVLWATLKTLRLNNRTTAGPIGLIFGIQLGTQQTINVCGSFLGCFSKCARAHPVFYISRTAEPIALIFGM